VTSNQRFTLETDSSDKHTEIKSYYLPQKNKPEKTIGINLGSHKIRWDYNEADDHQASDVEFGKQTKVVIASRNYAPGEEKIVSPTVWGPTQISNTNDDCYEKIGTGVDLDGLDGDGLAVGQYGVAQCHGGWRWQNVTIAKDSTINSASIEYDQMYSAAGPAEGDWWGSDEDSAADWSAGTAPSSRTKTSESVAETFSATNGEYASNDIATIIAEITSRAGWVSGNNLAIIWWSTEPDASDYVQIEDLSTVGGGSEAAILTVDYTAPAGGLSIPVAQSLRNLGVIA
jgi:hypothetical protein